MKLQPAESDQSFHKIVIGIGQWHIYFVATWHIPDASFQDEEAICSRFGEIFRTRQGLSWVSATLR
jgi:hypothetical protein